MVRGERGEVLDKQIFLEKFEVASEALVGVIAPP